MLSFKIFILALKYYSYLAKYSLTGSCADDNNFIGPLSLVKSAGQNERKLVKSTTASNLYFPSRQTCLVLAPLKMDKVIILLVQIFRPFLSSFRIEDVQNNCPESAEVCVNDARTKTNDHDSEDDSDC